MFFRNFFNLLGSGVVFRVNLSLIIFFVVSIIVFTCIYAPIQLTTCNQNIVRVPEYTNNSACFCSTNIGSSQSMAIQIINSTDFSSQFTRNYNPKVPAFRINDVNGSDVIIFSDVIKNYLENYWIVKWSESLIHEEIHIFDLRRDPSGIIPSILGKCVFQHAIGQFEFIFETKDDCLDHILKYVPSFNPLLKISYNENEVLRNFCTLDFCEINQCLPSQQFNIILFCITIASVMFTFFKICKFFIMYIIRRNNDPVNDLEMSAGT